MLYKPVPNILTYLGCAEVLHLGDAQGHRPADHHQDVALAGLHRLVDHFAHVQDLVQLQGGMKISSSGWCF